MVKSKFQMKKIAMANLKNEIPCPSKAVNLTFEIQALIWL
jgi:hypothetical protein